MSLTTSNFDKLVGVLLCELLKNYDTLIVNCPGLSK